MSNLDERIANLERLLAVQKTDGNWDYDAYQFGFANGMILALSVLNESGNADYLDRPKLFKSDLEVLDKLNSSAIIVS